MVEARGSGPQGPREKKAGRRAPFQEGFGCQGMRSPFEEVL